MLPSRDDLRAQGLTEMDILEPLATPAAVTIEQLVETGLGEVILDNSDELKGAVEDLNALGDSYGLGEGDKGCGCDVGTSPVPGLWMLMVLGLLLRREP